MQRTAPNPMVGAVIVCDGKIIGEGYHVRCGEAHAEVNAIRSVKDDVLVETFHHLCQSGTVFPLWQNSSLCIPHHREADSTHCYRLSRPFFKVAGRGIQKLQDAGREVTVGVLEKECKSLIRRFITFHTLHRPYITLKWAESADSYIDYSRTDGKPVILSTPLTSMLVHKKRAETVHISRYPNCLIG